MTLEDIQKTSPGKRLSLMLDNLGDLERFSAAELREAGRLLCHASSPEMRRDYPIIGDLHTSPQQHRDEDLYGDGFDKRGHYEPLAAAGLEPQRDEK